MQDKHVNLGWNNLGMHCYNPDFSNPAVLPPYNAPIAQVVKVGDPAQIVTSGVINEYNFPVVSIERVSPPSIQSRVPNTHICRCEGPLCDL